MTPQLIGNPKSRGFRACERYCRERRLEYQTRDPGEKPLGARELDAIIAGVGDPAELIDTESRPYRDRGLAWQDFDPREELLEDARLLRQPIVRTDRGVAVDPDARDLDRLFGRQGG